MTDKKAADDENVGTVAAEAVLSSGSGANVQNDDMKKTMVNIR